MRHFEEQLDQLRKRLLEMSGLVEFAIYTSAVALAERDEAQARHVLDNESRINNMQRDPAAVLQSVDLMFVAHDLERIADHATNIAEVALYLVEGIDVRHHAEVRK